MLEQKHRDTELVVNLHHKFINDDFRPHAASVIGSLISLQSEMEKETQRMERALSL